MISALLAATIVTAPFSLRPTVLANFSNGTFGSSWNITSYTYGINMTASTQRRSDGNPDWCIRMNTAPVNPSAKGLMYVSHALNAALLPTATWNPASGAITSIDASYDARHPFSSPVGGNVFILLSQGGKFYIGAQDTVTTLYTWTNCTYTGWISSYFWEIDAATLAANYTSHPDFSTSGAAITFGFAEWGDYPYHGIWMAGTADIDNWSVTVNG